MTDIDRRTFLTGLSAASAFTIVPRRVLGGQGFVAPSDMIRLAQVGCGLQSQRQVNTGFVRRPDVQFVAVVDPNRDSQDYVDWSEFGNRNQIRKFLEDPNWGAGDKGIRGGREVAREIMETYYKKQQRPGGIRAYEALARCSRRRLTSRASSTSRPTISTATSTSQRSRRAGRRSRTSQSRASCTKSGARYRRQETAPPCRTCSPTATAPTGTR